MTFRYIASRILINLERKEKLFLIMIFFLILFSAVLEMITISSLIPFLNIMLNPDVIYENFKFKYLIIKSDLFEQNPFAYITTFFIFVIIFTTIFKLIVLKLTYVITKLLGYKISSKVFKNVISQSYLKFTEKNTSQIISILETKINITVGGIFNFLKLLSGLIISISIIITLLIINFWATITFSFFFISCYMLLFAQYKKKLDKLGSIIALNLKLRVKVIQETISVFRQLKLDKISKYFYDSFIIKDYKVREGDQKVGYISSFPRIAIEGLGIISIALVSYYMVKKGSFEESDILTLIATMVFAASRMLPSLQNIYHSITFLIGQKKIAADIIEFLDDKKNNKEIIKNKNEQIKFNESIILKDISFGYRRYGNNLIFKDLNLIIKKNSTVGILGKTGCGKSTLVDIIAGLLEPNKGEVLVDNKSIKQDIESWYEKISYIDQNVTLLDTSIRENIALGKEIEKIDSQKIEKASLQSQSKEFIMDLPEKYQTKIGERGIRLSGGQIQRLGIARALYKNSELLILDESTSSLDIATEELILKSLSSFKGTKTIIIISHKFNTLKNCDKIYEIKDKQVKILNNE
tara:strand:- start:1672 stop:3414 length:1743 start_codon:yes stop_codon:yes gene_type:complete